MHRSATGEGYQYLRYQSRGHDVTVYFHQLAALRAGHSVEEVFADDTEVHHWYPIKEWNVPENVEVLHIEEHGERHRDRFPDRHELRGRE